MASDLVLVVYPCYVHECGAMNSENYKISTFMTARKDEQLGDDSRTSLEHLWKSFFDQQTIEMKIFFPNCWNYFLYSWFAMQFYHHHPMHTLVEPGRAMIALGMSWTLPSKVQTDGKAPLVANDVLSSHINRNKDSLTSCMNYSRVVCHISEPQTLMAKSLSTPLLPEMECFLLTS